MRESVITSAVRLPTGKFLGALHTLPATDLGARVVREAVARAGIDPGEVDECIMGNVVSAGLGQAPARQAALGGGLPDHVGALTINKVCGSGLKAVMLAAQGIATGDIDVAVAGGMESMSNCPYMLPKARTGMRMGNGDVLDSMMHDGLWCAIEDWSMGPGGRGGGRALRCEPRGPGRLRGPEPPEGGRGDPLLPVQGRDPARGGPPAARRPDPPGVRRGRPGRLHGRVARTAAAGVQEGRRDGHGRERPRRERRGRPRSWSWRPRRRRRWGPSRWPASSGRR